jgi:hypothetical protein
MTRFHFYLGIQLTLSYFFLLLVDFATVYCSIVLGLLASQSLDIKTRKILLYTRQITRKRNRQSEIPVQTKDEENQQ